MWCACCAGEPNGEGATARTCAAAAEPVLFLPPRARRACCPPRPLFRPLALPTQSGGVMWLRAGSDGVAGGSGGPMWGRRTVFLGAAGGAAGAVEKLRVPVAVAAGGAGTGAGREFSGQALC